MEGKNTMQLRKPVLQSRLTKGLVGLTMLRRHHFVLLRDTVDTCAGVYMAWSSEEEMTDS